MSELVASQKLLEVFVEGDCFPRFAEEAVDTGPEFPMPSLSRAPCVTLALSGAAAKMRLQTEPAAV
jgi:hypothetical protein